MYCPETQKKLTRSFSFFNPRAIVTQNAKFQELEQRKQEVLQSILAAPDLEQQDQQRREIENAGAMTNEDPQPTNHTDAIPDSMAIDETAPP